MATVADLREYAGLPDEAPEALLARHLEAAQRDLKKALEMDEAPEGRKAEWSEAEIVLALRSATPFLHTFSLSGAARATRLLGMDSSVEFRFLDPGEVNHLRDVLMARYRDLLTDVRKSSQAEDEGEDETDGVQIEDAFSMEAV